MRTRGTGDACKTRGQALLVSELRPPCASCRGALALTPPCAGQPCPQAPASCRPQGGPLPWSCGGQGRPATCAPPQSSRRAPLWSAARCSGLRAAAAHLRFLCALGALGACRVPRERAPRSFALHRSPHPALPCFLCTGPRTPAATAPSPAGCCAMKPPGSCSSRRPATTRSRRRQRAATDWRPRRRPLKASAVPWGAQVEHTENTLYGHTIRPHVHSLSSCRGWFSAC
jgi:hypothetical protein